MSELDKSSPKSQRIPSRRDDSDADRAARMGIPASSRPGQHGRGQRFIDTVKTFLWVAPLTVLIWVYAERAQRTRVDLSNVQLQVVSASPERIVTLREPTNRTVELELNGPKAGLDAARDLLSRPLPLTIPDQYAPSAAPVQMNLADLLTRNETLSRFGVSIERTRPPTMSVQIQEKATITVAIRPKPDARFSGRATFEPETVELSLPKDQLPNLKDQVVYAEMSKFYDREARSEPYPPEDVPLLLLTEKAIENVTINPARARASVTITPSGTIRTPVPLVIGVFAQDLRNNNITRYTYTPSTATLPNIDLSGPPETLQSINNGTTPVFAFVHFAPPEWREGEFPVQVKAEHYQLPPRVKVVNPDQTFNVIVRER